MVRKLKVKKYLQVRHDILSRFMSMEDGCEEECYDDKKLRDVCINFIIAGRDTTAITLSWLFSELCKHPEVVENILSEVSDVLGEEQDLMVNSDPDQKLLTAGHHGEDQQGFGDRILDFAQKLNYNNLTKMHYLHAAITEALRLYPAVPLVRSSFHFCCVVVPCCHCHLSARVY